MKKIIFLLIIAILIIPIFNIYFVNAQTLNDESYVTQLRAGGGGSGGGSGGSGGGSSHGHGGRGDSYCDYRYDPLCIINNILSWIMMFVLMFFTTVVLYFKVIRSSINSKRYLRLLSKKDIAWKYKNIEKQAIETFYVVQKAWTNMDMTPAKKYMDKDLYESFKGKLEWMEIGNKRNILKRIRLINLRPVSIHDDEDDDKDLVWFYINGSMVDYMINTETHEKIEGNNIFSMPFVEFWKFTRKGNKWVLSKILQSNEANQIDFE